MKQLDQKPKIGAHPAVEADRAFSKGRREGPGNPSVPESWETETHTGQKPSSVLDRGDESPGTREGGTLDIKSLPVTGIWRQPVLPLSVLE